ncbi:MAG: hypothetical protein JSV58_03035, partial [Candidatus Bathyarchaeota archaeon]
MGKLNRVTACLVLLSLMLVLALVPYSQGGDGWGPEVLRFQVVTGPDYARLAMQTGMIDVYPDLWRTVDVEALDSDGFLITQDVGFHMGFIAYNIRADQSYRRSDSYWPLADMEFRHALFHCYDQMGIIPPIYGYIVTPINSLVPPAQSKYHNSAVPTHPYDPGNPFTSTSGDHDSCGILLDAGYTFVDADSSGNVTETDYWKCPNSSNMPYMELWTPLQGVAPVSWQHGHEFVADLAEIGLKATAANGNRGWLNIGRDFNDYLSDVYDRTDFDAYMVFYGMGRIPDQLYSFLHSSQDCLVLPGADGAPDGKDHTIDTLVETVRFSLDPDAIEVAAKQVQEMLYTSNKSKYPNADAFALAYMMMYSRIYFNSYATHLEGVIKSPGYGSDNGWTRMNIR